MKPGYLDKIRRIGATVAQLARHEITIAELVRNVRQRHPYSTHDDVAQGAFHAVVEAAETSPEQTSRLHRIALEMRDARKIDKVQ